MITKSLAILLAVLGLMLSAVESSAQPRMGGGWGRGGGGFGGFRPRAAARPFAMRPYGGRPFGQRPYGQMGGGGPYGGARPYGQMGGYGGGYPAPYGGGGYMGGPRAAFGGDWPAQQNQVRQAVREGRQVPLSQAIEAVRRRAPGRELDAGMEAGPGGRPVYRLRWAGQDGRRQDYIVDAGTGAVLGVQGGGQPAPWGGP